MQEALPQDTRRGFFAKLAAIVIGAIAGLIPVLAGLGVLFDPLRRKAGASSFYRVTQLGALPEDGSPRRFAIKADQVDAWNRYRDVPVGSVYLRRTEGGVVQALHATCPHAGCFIDYKSTTGSFLCPCHDSQFHLDGSLASAASPSPRGMDSLEVEVRNDQEVWVKFQNFEAGKAEKVAIV